MSKKSGQQIRPEYDVIVVGGGASGAVAAIASARLGARTLLVERHNCAGGVATSGLLSLLGPFDDRGERIIKGIPEEMLESLIHRGGAEPKERGFIPVNPETLKLVLDEMLQDSGAEVLYDTLAADVQVREGIITGVTAANKSGLIHLAAKVFVDATGDGDVAFRAGLPYEVGRARDGWVQPMTMVCRLGGVDLKTYRWEGNFKYAKQMQEAAEKGEFHIPTDQIGAALPVPGTEGVLAVNMSHIYDLDPTSAKDLTKAHIEGRRQAQEILRFFRKYVAGCRDAYLLDTASSIGVRESRRFQGRYILTKADVLEGRRFGDAVAANAYHVDIHKPPSFTDPQAKLDALEYPRRYYHIPYRCLLPAEPINLLLSGRCISVSHEALASVRIMPCCMAIGQAAGTAAALGALKGVLPHELETPELHDTLHRESAFF